MSTMNIRPTRSFLFKGIVDGKVAARDVVVGKQNVITTSIAHARQLTASGLGKEVPLNSSDPKDTSGEEAAKAKAEKEAAAKQAEDEATKAQAAAEKAVKPPAKK